MSKQKEPNLMGHYFDPDSRTYEFIERLRKGLLEGTMSRFRSDTIEAVQEEINRKRRELDRSTYQFAQDLGHLVLSGDRSRVVLLVSGKFYGEYGIVDSVLGFDLGSNPHGLFSRQTSNDTIDSKVSLDKTREYITQNLSQIKGQGFIGFNVELSSFFYFSEIALRNFERDGEINMTELIPMLMTTYNVGLEPVKIPSAKHFSANLPIPFSSYRLKSSMIDKLLTRLCYKHIPDDKVLGDWASHRIVVATEDDTRGLFEYLKSSPKIGRDNGSSIEFLEGVDGADEDYLGQFYDSYVNPDSRAHHFGQDRRRTHGKSGVNSDAWREAKRLLELAFGQRNFFIEARPYIINR